MTRRGRRAVGLVRAVVLASALVGLAAGPASAHPHVFIDYAVTLVVAGDRVDGVRLAWTFDDLFSGFILQEFDKDRNGTLSAGGGSSASRRRTSRSSSAWATTPP